MSIKRRKSSWFQFRRPEELESREMLAGHSFGALFAAREFISSMPAIVQQFNHHSRTSVSSLSSSSGSSSSGGSEYSNSEFTATLSDSSNASAAGTATYQTGTLFGVTVNLLTISVTGAAASTTLPVTIGTTSVGSITTDSTGAGTLVLSSNPTSTQTQFPAGLSITSGTAITVGTLSGSFAASTNSGGHHCGGGAGDGDGDEGSSGTGSTGTGSTGTGSTGTGSTGTGSGGTFSTSISTNIATPSSSFERGFSPFGRFRRR